MIYGKKEDADLGVSDAQLNVEFNFYKSRYVNIIILI